MSDSMQINYIGLPACRCRVCDSSEFAVVENSLQCVQCPDFTVNPTKPPRAWLIGVETANGLRWAANEPPHDSSQAAAIVFIASDLSWTTHSPSSVFGRGTGYAIAIGDVCEDATQKFVPLTRSVFGWLVGRIEHIRRTAFSEDADEVAASLLEAGRAAVECGWLGAWAADPAKWPTTGAGFGGGDPWSQLDAIVDLADRCWSSFEPKPSKPFVRWFDRRDDGEADENSVVAELFGEV